MFQERENEISLRKWSGGTAHLRTLEEHCLLQPMCAVIQLAMNRSRVSKESRRVSVVLTLVAVLQT